jgi:hypothetical protein
MDRTIRTHVATVTGLALLVMGCSMCGDDVSGTSLSPDGRWAVTAYVRDCGATTSFVTHVVIRHADEPFKAWQGNGGPDQGLVLVMEQRPVVSFSWQDSTHLTIGLAGEGGRVVKQETSWHSVAIHYEH